MTLLTCLWMLFDDTRQSFLFGYMLIVIAIGIDGYITSPRLAQCEPDECDEDDEDEDDEEVQ